MKTKKTKTKTGDFAGTGCTAGLRCIAFRGNDCDRSTVLQYADEARELSASARRRSANRASVLSIQGKVQR